MACLLSCFLPFRSASRRAFTVVTSRPGSADDSSYSNTRPERVTHSTSEQPEVHLSAGLGSRWLRVDNCPEHDLHDLFENLDGFQRCGWTSYYHRVQHSNISVGQVEFDSARTAAGAARRLNGTTRNSEVIRVYVLQDLDTDLELIPGSASSMVAMASGEEPHPQGPPRKRPKLSIPVKLVCKICTSEIAGPYSKPCLKCKEAWCLDCVKTWFVHATQDPERMPARCCNMVMHHGVVGGTLSPLEFDLYKLRYEERTTPNPLYCPSKVCSTFIPPRLIDANQDTVNCTSCASRVCTKCKQLSATHHVCEADTTAAKIKASFKYKTCPRCGHGIVKMFGCSHTRCVCGANFCYVCMLPIDLCHQNSCVGAIEDGQYGNERVETLSDSEDEIEDTSTITEMNVDSQTAHPNPTIATPVNSAEAPNALRVVFNVFRERLQRRADSEARSHELAAAPDLGESNLQPAISSGYSAALELALQSFPDLENPVNTEGISNVGLLVPEVQTTVTSLPAMSTPPAIMPNEASTLDIPLAITNPPAPMDGNELIIETSENCSCMYGQCRDGSDPLCMTERGNPASSDPIAELLPAPQILQLDSSVEGSADTAAPLRPTYPSSPAIEPLAAELPFAQSSTTDLDESDFWTRPNPAVFPTVLPPVADPPTPNLDDPSLLDWEGGAYDFGEEPVGEAFDVWGCVCNFMKLKKDDVNEHWLQDVKYLDCMKCFGEVVLQTTPQFYSGMGDVKQVKEKLAWLCAKCGIVVCGKCVQAKKKELKSLLKTTRRERE